MILYSTVSFILNSIHFHSFLALFFLSLSKNVKDAAFLLKRSFNAAFMQTCVKAVETQVWRSFYADLRKAVETQVLHNFYADLRKSCRNADFTQVRVKAVEMLTCIKAVETQLLRRSAALTKLFCSFWAAQKLQKS